MNITDRKILEKYKVKNRGNSLLNSAIDNLLDAIENKNWKTQIELKKDRPDADCVHSDGYYFFDIKSHRTMILIEFEDDGEATIIWCGSHSEYNIIFNNNKKTIKDWLKKQGHI